MREETTHPVEEGMAEKHARTDKSDTKMDTEAGGGRANLSHVPRQKKGHMTNIYLADSEKGGSCGLAKDHEELYNKTNEYFKDQARKECLWEWITNSHKLSVKVCKTWYE